MLQEKSKFVAIFRLGLIVLFALTILFILNSTSLLTWLNPESIEVVLEKMGWLAIPIFILLYGIFTAAWIPGTIMTLVGAALFGPILAIPINYFGAVFGAWLGYYSARFIGGDALNNLFSGRIRLYDRYQDLIARRGFESILYLRLIPTPYNAISYLAGLSPISATRFITATAIGILPGSIAITFFLGTIIEELQVGNWSALFSFRLVAALSVFVVGAMVPKFAKFAQRKWGWFKGINIEVDVEEIDVEPKDLDV